MITFTNQFKITAVVSTLLCLSLTAGCSDDKDSTTKVEPSAVEEAQTEVTETEAAQPELDVTANSQGEVAQTDVAVYKSLDELDMLKATDNIANRD